MIATTTTVIEIYTRTKRKPACPHHGQPLVYRTGQYGGFYACDHYPDGCDITAGKSEHDGHFHMTNQVTREARKAAHAAFDSLWTPRSETSMPRARAYRWLAEALGIETRQCHMQHFDAATCRRVVELVAARLLSPSPAATGEGGK